MNRRVRADDAWPGKPAAPGWMMEKRRRTGRSRHDADGKTRALVLEIVDAWNAHDLDRMESFYAPDFEGHDVSQARARRGPKQARDHFAGTLRALPDVRFEIESIVADGDRAAVAWTATGTHAGSFLNIPPTGKRVRVRGASMITLRDGKIVASSAIWDVAGLLRSIGLLPEL